MDFIAHAYSRRSKAPRSNVFACTDATENDPGASGEPALRPRLSPGSFVYVPEYVIMAPRANWKGLLRLSLVTCPVALYPATSDSEKISFNRINRETGHRIKYLKVDADTGEEVASDEIMKGYKVDTDTYIEVTKDELQIITKPHWRADQSEA
jgi:hypothetical protein